MGDLQVKYYESESNMGKFYGLHNTSIGMNNSMSVKAHFSPADYEEYKSLE